MEWDPYDRNCPTRLLLDRIGDRWTVLTVHHLELGPQRFSELARRLDGISEKVLTQTLRGLERDGLVTRTVEAAVPVKVTYELTALGHTLYTVIHGLTDWAVSNVEQVLAARSLYDSGA